MESGTLGSDRDHNPRQLSSLHKTRGAIASSCLIIASTPLVPNSVTECLGLVFV